MTTQVNRTYELLIGDYQTGSGLLITDKQVSFDVSKSSDNSSQQNSASIEINNLSKDQLKILETEYPAAFFKVGWGGVNKLLFGGEVVTVSTRKQGTERVTQLILGTGYVELNHNVISKNVPPGKTVKDCAQAIAAGMPNVKRTVFNGTNINNPVINGYSLTGTYRECLDSLSDTYKLEWRIDDGVLYVNDKSRAETENFQTAYIISPSSGLIEIPYYQSGNPRRSSKDDAKKNSVQFSMLLNPDVIPGKIILLEDTDIAGYFKVESCRYSGSWRNGTWLQDVYASALEKVNTNKK